MRDAAEEGFTTATAVADALVREGVPFRSAHHVVGALVAEAERAGVRLVELDDATIQAALLASEDPTAVVMAADGGVGELIRASASIEGALAACDVVGGTAPERVAAALATARARLKAEGGLTAT